MTKKILIKGILFIIPLFILFYFLQYLIDNGLKHTKKGNYAEWNDVYNSKINSDLIILGSSRATFHISPKILDSVLHINTYNLGITGYNFDMQNYRFKIFLEHNKTPKYIIHSLDIFTLDRRKDLYLYEQFLPYLDDPLIREAVKGYEGEFSAFQYHLYMYKYFGHLEQILIGLLEEFNIKHFSDYKYKGYIGQNLSWNNDFDKFKKSHRNKIYQTVNNETIKAFEEYLSFCQKNNIKVYLVYSPEYYEAQSMYANKDSIIAIYTDCAKKYNALFIDSSNDSLSKRKDLFYNSQHLTKKGSELFSLQLANKLKVLMK